MHFRNDFSFLFDVLPTHRKAIVDSQHSHLLTRNERSVEIASLANSKFTREIKHHLRNWTNNEIFLLYFWVKFTTKTISCLQLGYLRQLIKIIPPPLKLPFFHDPLLSVTQSAWAKNLSWNSAQPSNLQYDSGKGILKSQGRSLFFFNFSWNLESGMRKSFHH